MGEGPNKMGWIAGMKRGKINMMHPPEQQEKSMDGDQKKKGKNNKDNHLMHSRI
jgi:hypothetical protein